MAIIFTKQISETYYNNAYNNNIVVFNSNSGKTATKCVINNGGANPIEITPNPSGVFRYNFKEYIRSLINNNFIDVIDYQQFKYNDLTNKSFTINYTIHFTDSTTETIAKTYKFIRRVQQIGKETLDNGLIYLNGTNLVMWEGYPFDIFILGYASNTTVTNENEDDFVLTSPFTRISLGNITYEQRLINDGYTIIGNPCVTVPDYIPIGHSTLTVGNTILNIEKRDVCDGQYLKWFNTDIGAWSYWMFNAIYKENLQHKIKDSFVNDNENLSDTQNTELLTGKETDLSRTLIAEHLSRSEKNLLNTILASPKVELYQDEIFQSVIIEGGTFLTEDKKLDTFKMNITIKLNHYSY